MSQIKPRSEEAFFKIQKTLAPRYGGKDVTPFPVGKRTIKRQEMNRELNKLEIKQCEIRLPGCWKTSHLQWCHATKSRFIVTDKDWKRAARGCAYCHHVIEQWKHKDMAAIIDEAIARRKE